MKNYLVCIDSDGCAIDSMEIKHRRCFGPCMIEVFELEQWADQILIRWNQINLYSKTRGINRFLGLLLILSEIQDQYTTIDGLDAYRAWCNQTKSFSNAAILEKIAEHTIFSKVLEWSQTVNHHIESISPEILPFDGVAEILGEIHRYADIAIVSSANPQAVQDEWTRFGLMDCVDYVMAQDAGTKSSCIYQLLNRGYDRQRVLMVGDAPGDAKAAQDNGVLFYPILAGREIASWKQLQTEALTRLRDNHFDSEYQARLMKAFDSTLETF